MGFEMDSKGYHVWEAVENFTKRSIFGRVVVEPPTKASKKGRVPRVVKKPERWYFCDCGRAYMNKKRLQEHKMCHLDLSLEDRPVAQKEKRKRSNDEEETSSSLYHDGTLSPNVIFSPVFESRGSFDGLVPEEEMVDLNELYPCTKCDSVLNSANDLRNHSRLYHEAGNHLDFAVIPEVDLQSTYRSVSCAKSWFGSDTSKSPKLTEILGSPDASVALSNEQSEFNSLFEDLMSLNICNDHVNASEICDEQFDIVSFAENHHQDLLQATCSADYGLVEEVSQATANPNPNCSNILTCLQSSVGVPSALPPESYSATVSSELQQTNISGTTSDTAGNAKYHETAAGNDFYCEQCNRKFYSKASLRLHAKKNHFPDGYRCKYCQCTFKSINSVKGHLVVNHKGAKTTDFLPPLAQTEISSEAVHQIELYTCSLCNHISTARDEFETHCHQQHLHLPEVQKTVTRNSEEDVERRKDWNCNQCGIQFKRSAEAVSHKERHHVADGHFPCTLCTCVYNDDSSLQVHHHLKHGDSSKEISLHTLDGPPPPQNRLKFVCTLCGRSYSQFSGLKAHKTISHKEKGISCPSCSCQFDSLKDFEFHRNEYHKYKDVSSLPFNATQSRQRGRPRKSYRFSCQYFGCDYIGSVQSDLSNHIQGSHIKGNKKMVQGSLTESAYNTRSKTAPDRGLPENENQMIQWQRAAQDEPMVSLFDPHIVDSGMHESVDVASFNLEAPVHAKQNVNQTEESSVDVPVIMSVKSLRDCKKPSQPKCEICGQVFLRPRSLWSHRKRSHVENGTFRCSYCSCTFRSERNLTTHMLIYHARRMERVNYPRESWSLKCQDCGELAKTNRRLASHRKRAHVRCGHFSCADCYCVFGHYTALAVHRLQRHRSIYLADQVETASKLSEPLERNTSPSSQICDSSGDLINTSHTSTPSRRASDSSLSSSSSDSPEEPQRLFQCNACALKFSHIKSLKNHQNVRHGLNKTCQLCNLSFASQDELLTHTNAVHSLLHVPRVVNGNHNGAEPLENLNSECTESLDSIQLSSQSPAALLLQAKPESQHSNNDVIVVAIINFNDDQTDSLGRVENPALISESFKDVAFSTGPPKLKSKRTSWKCLLCKITFRKKYRLTVHNYISHSKPARFSCQKCLCTFSVKYAQQLHSQYAHPKRLGTSTIGDQTEWKQDKQLAELNSVNQDVGTAENKDAYMCKESSTENHCQTDENVSKRSVREITLMTQNGFMRESNKLGISKCRPLEPLNIEKGFFPRHILRNPGKAIHLGEGTHVCQLCGIKFRRAFLLHRHERINHPGSLQYLCEKCPTFTVLSTELAFHENIFHSDLKNVRDILKERRLKAPVPNEDTEHSKKSARKNIPVDLDKVISSSIIPNGVFKNEQGNNLCSKRRQWIRRFGIYSCRLCLMMFSTKQNLSSHISSHVGVKPYRCSFCPVKFRLYRHCLAHKKKHLSLKILSNENQVDRSPAYQCTHCQIQLKSQGLINIHVEEAHPELKYLDLYKQVSIQWEEGLPECPIMPRFDTLFS